MFCRKCGTDVGESKFCPNCGAEIATPKATASGAPIEPAAQNFDPQPQSGVNPSFINSPQSGAAYPNSNPQMPQGGAYPNNNPQTPQGAYPNNNQIPNAPYPNYTPYAPMPQKKKGKGGVIAGVVIAVIAVIALAGFLANKFSGGGGVGGSVKRSASPEVYYQSVEKNSLATLSAHVANFADLTGSLPGHGNGGNDTTISFTFTEDGKELMMDDDEDMSWLNSMSLIMSSVGGGSDNYSEGTFNINDSRIVSFGILADVVTDEMLVKFPDFSQKFMATSLNEEFEEMLTACPDMNAVKAVIERYGVIIIENLDKVEKTTETVTVGATSAEYDVLVATIDREISANIAREVAQTARTDGDLEKLIRYAAEKDGEDGDAAYAEFLADLDEAESYNEGDENEVRATMTVYVDKKGDVCGRRYVSYEDGEEVNYYLTAWDGNNFETEASLDSLSITGSGSRSGNIITGDYTLRSGDVLIGNLRVDEFDKKAAKNGQLRAVFDYTPGKDYIDETGQSPMLATFNYKFDITSETGSVDALISVYSDGVSLGSVKFVTNAKKSVSIPAIGADDRLDADTWMDFIDEEQAYDTLYNALINAGVPEDYIE